MARDAALPGDPGDLRGCGTPGRRGLRRDPRQRHPRPAQPRLTGRLLDLADEGLALFVYAPVVLAVVVPIALGRLRRAPQDREQEEVTP